jgi:hypothetical protein
VCYVYRRHLELKSESEAWEGEQKFFGELLGKIESNRERLGRNPGGPCIKFYQDACYKAWEL